MVQRLNSNKVTQIHKPSALDPDLQAGKMVRLTRIPEDIKKAKRFFEVNKEYKIQEPPKNYLNTGMAVYLKGSDGERYWVGFPYFTKVVKKSK